MFIATCLAAALLLGAEPASAPTSAPFEEAIDPEAAPKPWWQGDHLTGEWNGARSFLNDHGFTIDAIYTVDLFGNFSRVRRDDAATTFFGHADLQLTFDTTPILWPGGKVVVLAQASHGLGVTEGYVGAYNVVSNLESPPFVQLGEFFIEQALFGNVLTLRFGKQDSNRDFGAPRYGGNFINNSFGAVPTVPMPSYFTQGLGGYAQVAPTDWLTIKAGLYEGQPKLASFGFDSAVAALGQVVFLGGVSLKHTISKEKGIWGLTSISAWVQNGSFTELTDDPAPRAFDLAYGGFILHDEHIGHVTINVRAALTTPDRQDPFFYFGAAIAYHDLPWASDDTVGVGAQVVRFSHPLGGAPGPGDELVFELFYKARLTRFFSLQPDFQIFHNIGGDGPMAFVGGLRAKVKL